MATRQAGRSRPRPDGVASASRGQAKRTSPPSRGRRFRRRYAVVYDIEGPRVRLGMLWFVVAAVALAIGPFSTSLVYGVTAAIAAAQVARVWRRLRLLPGILEHHRVRHPFRGQGGSEGDDSELLRDLPERGRRYPDR